MKSLKPIILVTIIVVVLLLLMGPFFIVDEGEQAVVTRFGKIVKTVQDAGLYFKVPMVEKVRYYPKKIQPWDGDPQLYPTEENQYIWVDITARWKIIKPKLFYERLGEINSAHQWLDQVINSSARDIVATHSLRESVRNSNIINEIERKDVYGSQTGPVAEGDSASRVSTFTKVTYEGIKKGREELSQEMLERATKEAADYGIKIIDIIIRQIKYSDDITQNVYKQMIKERNQIAQAFRSDGEGEKAKWLGKMEKELLTIRSEAEKTAKEIKSKADAEALDIRNKAYGQSPDFAEFWMALVEYQKIIPKMKKIITTDFEFFKYLYRKDGK
jgi:modulator of FtsH protease HflC